jgi:hypothetical protein
MFSIPDRKSGNISQHSDYLSQMVAKTAIKATEAQS